MAAPARMEPSPDFVKLAAYLEALANPGRLALLHQLREPKAASEILLQPSEGPGLHQDRYITRPAVRKQLARLREVGLVASGAPGRGGNGAGSHVVDHQMVFALLEELRRVLMVTPTVPPPPAATMTGGSPGAVPRGQGPRLVVVHGARQGQTFRLDPHRLDGPQGWVIGRARGLAVSLDYDPFVSQEHAEVVRRDGDFLVADRRENKNGTELNFEPLERGGTARVETGDLIGVGRTLLLFRR